MNILIVDDEALARSRLRELLADIDGCEVTAEASNGKQALQSVDQNKPDLVIMDIRMPVMDGLEAAHHLNRLEMAPAIIFATAYEEHALRAFDENAVDYLVKPIRRDRLGRAMEKARHNLSSNSNRAKTRVEDAPRSHICARYLGILKLVPIADVIYFHAEHKYVTVHHGQGEVLIEDPLKQLESEFHGRFLRIHRSALVAVDHIVALEKSAAGTTVIRLRDADRTLEVSRRNLPAVRKILKSL